MTPEQILGIAEGQAYALEQQNQLLQRFNQPVVQPQPDRFDLDIQDDQYIDGKTLKQIVSRVANQGPPADYGARQLAAQALWSNLQMQRADDFRRWGPEIEREVGKLPVEHWTLDNLKICVDIVKSRHIDELAAEKAQRLVDESHPTIRSGTGGSGGVPQQQVTLEADGIPAEWREAAKAAGITDATIRQHCEEYGIPVAQYYADLLKWGKGGLIRG